MDDVVDVDVNIDVDILVVIDLQCVVTTVLSSSTFLYRGCRLPVLYPSLLFS